MKKCPKCKKKTLKTREEEMGRVMKNIHSIGDYMGYQPWRTADDWSCCTERCMNPKCGYIK